MRFENLSVPGTPLSVVGKPIGDGTRYYLVGDWDVVATIKGAQVPLTMEAWVDHTNGTMYTETSMLPLPAVVKPEDLEKALKFVEEKGITLAPPEFSVQPKA